MLGEAGGGSCGLSRPQKGPSLVLGGSPLTETRCPGNCFQEGLVCCLCPLGFPKTDWKREEQEGKGVAPRRKECRADGPH